MNLFTQAQLESMIPDTTRYNLVWDKTNHIPRYLSGAGGQGLITGLGGAWRWKSALISEIEVNMIYLTTVAAAEAYAGQTGDSIFVEDTESWYYYNATAKFNGSPTDDTEVYSRDGESILYANGNSSPSVAGRWVRINEPSAIGEPVPWRSATVPARFLELDGSTFSATVYPKLYTANGNSTSLEDWRGMTAKGTGASTQGGVTYTGPSVKAFQADKFQGWQLGSDADLTGSRNYYGRIRERDNYNTNAALVNFGMVAAETGAQGATSRLKAMDDGTNGDPRTGLYTDGPGIGVKWIVRAF